MSPSYPSEANKSRRKQSIIRQTSVAEKQILEPSKSRHRSQKFNPKKPLVKKFRINLAARASRLITNLWPKLHRLMTTQRLKSGMLKKNPKLKTLIQSAKILEGTTGGIIMATKKHTTTATKTVTITTAKQTTTTVEATREAINHTRIGTL